MSLAQSRILERGFQHHTCTKKFLQNIEYELIFDHIHDFASITNYQMSCMVYRRYLFACFPLPPLTKRQLLRRITSVAIRI